MSGPIIVLGWDGYEIARADGGDGEKGDPTQSAEVHHD
jgi:hypothetical protein